MLNKLKINVPIRFKNWAFWLGLVATMLAAIDVSPEMFTSWNIVANELVALLSNPYRLGCLLVAVVGVLTDPTTPGLGDSDRALNRTTLGKD